MHDFRGHSYQQSATLFLLVFILQEMYLFGVIWGQPDYFNQKLSTWRKYTSCPKLVFEREADKAYFGFSISNLVLILCCLLMFFNRSRVFIIMITSRPPLPTFFYQESVILESCLNLNGIWVCNGVLNFPLD